MKWLKFWFVPTYPKQALSSKQVEILDYIDQTLVEMHGNKPVIGEMKVKFTGVPYMSTMLNTDTITKRIGLEPGNAYIPRSVAFVIDSEGNWTFFYAVREADGSDDITNRLFIDCLNRTNNAR
jgi:hypothetical protein